MDIQKILNKFDKKMERKELERNRLQQLLANRKKRLTKCGAFARSTGKPCQRKPLANGRCRNHGGLSTGPTTLEGKATALANLKQFQNVTFRSSEGQST